MDTVYTSVFYGLGCILKLKFVWHIYDNLFHLFDLEVTLILGLLTYFYWLLMDLLSKPLFQSCDHKTTYSMHEKLNVLDKISKKQ